MDDFKKFLEAMKNGKAKGVAIELPEELAAMLGGGDEKREIGKVPTELLKRFRAWNKAQGQLDDELELFTKQAELEAEKKAEEIYGERRDELMDEKEAVWDAISKYLGVSRDVKLSINARNGMISSHDKNAIHGHDDDDTPIQ